MLWQKKGTAERSYIMRFQYWGHVMTPSIIGLVE